MRAMELESDTLRNTHTHTRTQSLANTHITEHKIYHMKTVLPTRRYTSRLLIKYAQNVAVVCLPAVTYIITPSHRNALLETL